ncbi:hypothetical protein BS78_05G233800 [Paspalum vaginatum]|nr:hypothetical protein BS78_05G233800 [Paspalum vaginatum]
MADPVAIVEKIIDIAIIIKEVVETVKENKEECHGIEKLVRRVSDLLSLLKESEMMRHRVVGGPLEDLGNAVSRARDVVTACQGKNIVCLWCKAAKLAKKLSQVKNDISNWMMLAIFATNVTTFVATKGQQSPHPDLFLVRTYRPPPMSEHLPSSPRVVVQDLLPTSSLPTDGPASPSSPRQVPPSYAPVTYCSQVQESPPPPPPTISDPQYTNVAPPMLKNPSHRPPKQPTPPPIGIPYKSLTPKHTSHHSPIRKTSPPPSPPPQPSSPPPPSLSPSPCKNIGSSLSTHTSKAVAASICKSSSSYSVTEVSGHISDPVSSTPSEDSRANLMR